MKKIFISTFLFSLFLWPAQGQVTQPSGVILVSAAPSGACSAGAAGQLVVSTGVIYTCQSGTWGIAGGGVSGGWGWERQGPVVVSQSNDPSPQAQEPSAMWDSSPEVLIGYSEVVKISDTISWWPASLGGAGVGLCFGESPDGLTPPTRISGGCPLASTINYGRSFMLPTRQSGNIVVLATNLTTGQGDIFSGTTMSGLTVTTSNVMSCGSNGTEVAGSLGNWAIANTSGNTWVMLYDCVTTNGNYADFRAVSTTGYTGPYTKTSTSPVLMDTAGSPASTSCKDGGGPWLHYDGTKLWVAIHCGPQGFVPTPYIYIGSSADLGVTWTFGSGPNLTAQTADEGLGLTTGQIADAFILPDFAGATGGGNRTTLYYSAYTNGCPGQTTCAVPSYIKAATINAPLATVLAGGSSDGAVYGPGISTYVAPPVSPLSPGAMGQWSTDVSGNFYAYIANGSQSKWSQYTPASWAGKYQDVATFVGTAGTAISSYTTAAGKTFALYTLNGTTPQSIPLLTGTGQAIVAAGTTATFGDVLDSLTPSSTDYTVSGSFTYLNATGTPLLGLFSRASSGANTQYILQCNISAQVCDMYRVVAGSVTQIGGNVALSWTVGSNHTLALSITGTTNPVILATADGTTLFSATDTGGISTAGQAGFRITGGSSMQVTNFIVQ